MAIPDKPTTRKEKYLAKIAGQSVPLPDHPITREEAYLEEIAKKGGGGTTNYEELDNLPSINGVELTGNKTSEDLKITADAVITEAITTNIEVGGIPSGATIAKDTTLTQLAKRMFVKETAPSVTFAASGSGIKEVGTSVTPTLTLTITGTGTGTPTSIEFYSGSTLLDTQSYVAGTNTYTYTMESAITATTTVKGVLKYDKSDGAAASVEKTAAYTFVMASYSGAVTAAPTDKAGIIALTKNVKNTKALTVTFNLSNQRSCYAYPASFGNLTNAKDSNGFEYIQSYTKTTVDVDDTSYNVYTLTDPVTASGFKQIYS